MNCQKLRSRFEDLVRADSDRRAESGLPADAEVSKHLMTCIKCRSFVEAQRELGAGLRLVRESAPRPGGSLDAAVLANYRGYIAAVPSGLQRFALAVRQRSFSLFGWSAAALALLAVLLLSQRRQNAPIAAQLQPAQLVVASKPTSTDKPATAISHLSGMKMKRKTHYTVSRRAIRRPGPTFMMSENSISAAFRGLMYCDPLSCGGMMEMIRVQLPFSATALVPSSTSADGIVYADVVVAPDGIARGIRIVQ